MANNRFVFHPDPQRRWRILKLLDDDYLHSSLTEFDYEVNSEDAHFDELVAGLRSVGGRPRRAWPYSPSAMLLTSSQQKGADGSAEQASSIWASSLASSSLSSPSSSAGEPRRSAATWGVRRSGGSTLRSS